MKENKNVKIGDWVRFQRMGELVVGVVAYVKNKTTYPQWEREVVTDIGSVDVKDILESRSAED